MRYLSLIAALCMADPAAAQDGPVAAFEWLEVSTDGPATQAPSGPGLQPLMDKAPEWASLVDDRLLITTGRQPLSSDAPTMIAAESASGEFSASTLVDYRALREGDLAGLVVRAEPANWISIQVEKIEPADLIAVRLRDGDGSSPAGRLIYTTALSGAFDQRVRLRIDADNGRYRLMFAQENGLWQILAEDVPGPAIADTRPVSIGLFGMDGADQPDW